MNKNNKLNENKIKDINGGSATGPASSRWKNPYAKNTTTIKIVNVANPVCELCNEEIKFNAATYIEDIKDHYKDKHQIDISNEEIRTKYDSKIFLI